MINKLTKYLNNSYTAYHAVKNAEELLNENGFARLSEKVEWSLSEGEKYYVTRNGSALIAFTVGSEPLSSIKIAASHADSPALKLKDDPIIKCSGYLKLNTEKYGGGILYSYLDRPLKIAGRITYESNGRILSETVVSDYTLVIPSQAIHINRSVNDGVALNVQADMCPLFDTDSENANNDLYRTLTDKKVLSGDLYLVNGEKCYEFGPSGSFIAGPRADNLTSVFSSLNALIASPINKGINICAVFDNEEIGNGTAQGSAGDFLEATLMRICDVFNVSRQQYYATLARSFLLSVDVAHAVHPNHPEKSDITNRPILGKGIAIKINANGSYVTEGKAAATVKTVFDRSGVANQRYYCRSDMPCGSTLGKSFICRIGMLACDIGIPLLAMHSACESFSKKDYESIYNGICAFYSSEIEQGDDEIIVR